MTVAYHAALVESSTPFEVWTLLSPRLDLPPAARDENFFVCNQRDSLAFTLGARTCYLSSAYFIIIIIITIYIYFFFFFFFWAALGLRCCMQAFSSCSEQGLLFVAVHRLLIVVVSLVVEHGL